MIVAPGATNVSVPFYFVDDVAGTAPGEPTTGLLFSDIETGGSASYQRQGAARVDFELVTLASAAAAHADGGFILVDDTEMAGVCRCDIPDAAVAAGVDFVIIYLRAAAAKNTITRPLKIELATVDLRGEDAYTGTLTVDDGSTGLEGVVVNARRGGVLKASGTTDPDGKITDWVFGAYTYDLALRLDDYQPETDTIAVSADAWSKTISLTAIYISAPPSASTITGVMTTYDEEGVEEESVKVSVQITEGPGTAGIGYDSAAWTETSNGSGVVQFAGIIKGATYKIWRGDTKANFETFTAPATGDSFDLAEVIGRG